MLVLYGVTVATSISALFMAGFLPGVLVAIGQCVVVALLDRKYHFPRRTVKYTREQILEITKSAIIPLVMPLIIVGGICTGVCTPTEAGVLAVVYALIVDLFVLKTIKPKEILGILSNTATMSAVIFMIIACAKVASYSLAALNMTSIVKNLFLSVSDNPIVFLLMINVLLLVMGMFMDGGASILLLAPILQPIAISLGINSIHFGLVMVLNLVIGLCTPPLGQCVYIGSKIARIDVWKSFKAAAPFLVSNLIVLLLVTYCEPLTMAIPRALGLA